MRILIAGGGPAGLTLAACLKERGIQSVVVEKARKGRTGGYSIGLHVNGWNVAEKLGVIEAFKAKAMPLGPALHKDRFGKKLFSYDYRTLYKASGGKILAVMREDFQTILTQHVETGVDIHYETTISGIAEDHEGINVTFSDGLIERFDLVVGADGYRSALREMLFGPHDEFLRPLGYRAAAWRVPVKGGLGASFVGMMDVDHQGGLYNIGDGSAATLFCWRDDSTSRLNAEQRREVLLEQFGTWPDPVASCLRSEIDWDASFFDTVSQIEVPKWSRGRVVLLGDSAWCLTFLAGQGTSTAMAGAYVLAAELARRPYAEAFTAYEDRLRPLVMRMQAVSRKIGGHYIPQSKFGMVVQSWVLPVMLSRPFIKLAARQFSAPVLPLDS